MQEEKPLYFIIMTVVMLVLSVALPLLNFTFWAYMGIISAVTIALGVGMYFFDKNTQDSKEKTPKVKKEKASVKEDEKESTNNNSAAHTGYFSHNY